MACSCFIVEMNARTRHNKRLFDRNVMETQNITQPPQQTTIEELSRQVVSVLFPSFSFLHYSFSCSLFSSSLFFLSVVSLSIPPCSFSPSLFHLLEVVSLCCVFDRERQPVAREGHMRQIHIQNSGNIIRKAMVLKTYC